MSRRYGGDYDEDMARARQRAQEGQRAYDEENQRDYEKWKRQNAHLFTEPSFYDRNGSWDFRPIVEESGRVSGFDVRLDGKKIAVVVPVRGDLVVLMTDPEGGVRADYKRGRKVEAQDVLDRFVALQQQGQLP